MKGVLIIVTVISSTLIPLSADAASVLLLGDGGSEDEVQPALEAAGHTVTFAGLYSAWDGASPAPMGFDAVVLLDGIQYGQPLQAGAGTALQDFVASGRGLVLTEWTAYDLCVGSKASPLADLMPVTMPLCFYYGYGAAWVVDDPSHQLAAGVPATWTDGAGWSKVEAKEGAVVVVSDDTSNPMVSYWKPVGGVVVHINHDLMFTTAAIDPNAMQVIVNAVDFADPLLVTADFEDGTTGNWTVVQ